LGIESCIFTIMFKKKKQSLFEVEGSKTTSNQFLNQGLETSARTKSGNMADKYSTTGNDFVDQFGTSGKYLDPRPFQDISNDMSTLWAKNTTLTLKFLIFLRIITRKVLLPDGSKTSKPQRGAGLKHESIMRMIWLNIHHRDAFWNILPIFIAVGSWKDIITMLRYDLIYNGWDNKVLDWETFRTLIVTHLVTSDQDLLRKYLPQLKAKSKCKTAWSQANTIIAKYITDGLSKYYESIGRNLPANKYKFYRLIKTIGKAHEWQKLISQKKFQEIDFNTVPGRAMMLLSSGNFIKNQGLEDKYIKWLGEQPVVKFTGYVHELFGKYLNKNGGYYSSTLSFKYPFQEVTLNKQFKMLVDTAKQGVNTNTSLIVVRDTSGSMGSTATGSTMSCGNIAKGLALFFSEMLPEGHFANSWIEFANTAKLHQWKGSTPAEKWNNDSSSYIGSTNFQSVIDLFVSIKQSGVAEDQFPSGILCISDGEFNPASTGSRYNYSTRRYETVPDFGTNSKVAFAKLLQAGFSPEYVSNFKIVLWNLQSRAYGDTTGSKFESYGNTPNIFYFSGYDGSIVSFLTDGEVKEHSPRNAEELFLEAMNQEVMAYIN
jgi:hypothetical protein